MELNEIDGGNKRQGIAPIILSVLPTRVKYGAALLAVYILTHVVIDIITLIQIIVKILN